MFDVPAAGLDETLAFGDVEGLPDGVEVPRGTGGWGEPDGANTHPCGFFSPGDAVDVDVPGEPLGWALSRSVAWAGWAELSPWCCLLFKAWRSSTQVS